MSIAEELVVDETAKGKTAVVYRMVTDEHVCPFGIKTVDLLKRKGFEGKIIGSRTEPIRTPSKKSMMSKRLRRPSSTMSVLAVMTICDSILAMSLKIRIRKPTRLSS